MDNELDPGETWRAGGWTFEYEPSTRFVGAVHPRGGRVSVCDVRGPSNREIPAFGKFIADRLNTAAKSEPVAVKALEGSMDGDSPLQSAAREAGWALMELVDSIDWTKRDQVSAIISRLGVALTTPPAAALDVAIEALEPFAGKANLVVDEFGEGCCPGWSPFIPQGAYTRAATALATLKAMREAK